MDSDDATRLEETIADAGTLLVQMEKFRARHGPEASALRAATLSIGDRARRAHRHGRLDDALAASLLADAEAARRALREWLANLRAGPVHRSAVGALARGDRAALGSALVDLFDGAAIEPVPPRLYRAAPWQRRGRPRPAAEVADDLAALGRTGLVGETDPLVPGVEPDLPAVVLQRSPPVGEPLHLVFHAAALPAWVLTFAATDDVLVPGARLACAFTVALPAPDDELDAWVLDPERYRAELRAALAARSVAVDAT